MTREEIEKLPAIIDMLLRESVIVDTKEKLNEKLTEVCNLAIKALEQEPTTKNDLALINTWGLDEEIRCTMCTNSMKSDRGCDGSCVVNNAMYKKVMDVIENHIQPTTRNDIRDNEIKDELKQVKNELEPTTKNCESCKYYGSHHEVCNYCYKCSLWTEQEPTTNNDLGVDCISRADVNQVIEDYMDEQYHVLSDRTRERAFGAKVVKARINELPIVIPQEPRKGHWIYEKTVFDKFGNTVECSSCHKKWKTYDEVRWRKENKYCPNCGVDMESEVEE